MADLQTGSEFAGCRIEALLGRGGMGVIYRATELRLGRSVALKLIATEQASDPDVRERFEREARMTASIEHPNVVPVYAAGEEDGHLYLVMRFVPGTDLHHLLRQEGRLTPARAASIVAQVADALDAAHAAGLVHRDVKPANILINHASPADVLEGMRDHAYLSDFGITRVQASDTRITDSGNWIGTVDFMAPEHLRGEPTDARADVYALGCVLFTALTGTPPFRRDTVPVTITAHLHDPPPRPSETPGVPTAFDAVIARALAKAPEDRYPSAGDLGRAARAAAAGERMATARGSVATGAATPEEAEPTRIAPAPGATAVVELPGGVVPDDATRGRAGIPQDAPRATAGDRAGIPQGASSATAATAHADAGDDAGALHGSSVRNGAGAPGRDQRRPTAVKVQRGRGRKLALAATLAVLAIPTVLVVRWVAGADGTPTGPLATGEVRDAAQSFAKAYSNEDDAALRRTLTPAVRRWGTSGAAQRGRVAVVGEYHRQFATSKVKDYSLDDLKVSGGRVGRAEGRYTVTRDGAPPITGRIVFGVIRRDGKPAIDLIATEPRA